MYDRSHDENNNFPSSSLTVFNIGHLLLTILFLDHWESYYNHENCLSQRESGHIMHTKYPMPCRVNKFSKPIEYHDAFFKQPFPPFFTPYCTRRIFLWTKSGLRCLRVVFSLNPTQSILIPIFIWIKYQNRSWGNCTIKSKLPYNCFPTDSHRTTTIRLQCFLLLRWQPEVTVHTTHWCWLRWITAVSKNRNALGLRRSKGGCLSTKPRQR